MIGYQRLHRHVLQRSYILEVASQLFTLAVAIAEIPQHDSVTYVPYGPQSAK